MNSVLDPFLLAIAVLLAVLLHEAGHLLASLSLGFHILGVSVGPMRLQTMPGDIKVTWSWRTLATAAVSAIPSTMDHWRQQMIIVVAAGPLATFVSALLIASLHLPGLHLLLLQNAFVQVSLLLFFLGLIPNGSRARQQNDARLLIDLVRCSQNADGIELQVWLKQQALQGVRPQDYPVALLQRMARFDGRIESRLLFAQTLVQWALDSEEYSKVDEEEGSEQIAMANAWDRHALALAEHCGARSRSAALASSACLDVVHRADFQSGLRKFQQVEFGTLYPTCFQHSSRAAREIAQGRSRRALKHIIRAQYALPLGNSHYTCERTLLDKLHKQALTVQDEPRKAYTASA